MVRVAVFGNNHIACSITSTLANTINIPNMLLVAVIPEGKDIVDKTLKTYPDKTWETSFYNFCKTLPKNIKVYKGNINEYKKELQNLNIDLLIGARSSIKVKKEILNIPTIGITNIHFGDLPLYGGCHTIQHAILNKEKFIGVAFHFMDENFDNGPIIHKEYIEIKNKTAFQLYQEATEMALDIFYIHNQKAVQKQSIKQKGPKSYYNKNSINFSKDKIIDIYNSKDIEKYIRAFYFPPLQTPILKCNGLTIHINKVE